MRYLFLLLPLGCFSQNNYGLHFAAGFGVGYLYSSSKKLTPAQSLFVSTGVSLIAGIGKEFYDSQKGYKMSQQDIMYTVAGGFVAGCIKYYIKRRRIKK